MKTTSLCALCLTLSTATAQTLELEGLDGRVTERELAGFETSDPRTAGAIFVRVLGFPAPPEIAEAARCRVGLAGGDVLVGRVLGGQGELLDLGLAGGAPLRLSIEGVRSLVFPGRLVEGAAPPEPAEKGDRLYRTRGRGLDRVDGVVVGFRAEGVAFEGLIGERTYAWDEVGALFVEALDEVTAPEDAPGVRVSATLRGGGRVSGRLVAFDAAGCRMTAAAGALALPAQLIAELAVEDGSYSFLSQLAPDDLGPLSPYDPPGVEPLGMSYPPRVDLAVSGDPLRAGGKRWSRGLGVHGPSRLTWKLDGGWKELRVQAAIDDQVLRRRARGAVRFRIWVDGEQRYESPEVQGGDPVLVIPAVALDGARELVLEVDPGDDWRMDRADWLRPLLIRA
jgi:hypothetical protein